MEGSEMVERLVVLLSLFKGARPLTLLLSTYVPFTPEVRQDVCYSADWDVFRQYVQKDLGAGERIAFLTRAFQRHQPLSGYQVLARLVKEGYFATVFTCGPDSYLEDHLSALGCYPRVLTVGGHSAEHIVQILENPPAGPCVIKLHGSLREGVLPRTFPEVHELPETLLSILRLYLNRDLMVIGSLTHDLDVARLLSSNRESSLYYILPEPPDHYDEVRRTIEARGQSLAACVLTGERGEFNNFFHTLEARLGVENDQKTPYAALNSPGSQSIIGPVAKADVLLVTVTMVETQAVLELFPHAVSLHHSSQTYYDLGLVEGAHVYLVQQPNMGSGEAGGSALTIHKGIKDLAPATVMMVGIAFGFERERFAIGDILVSEQLQMYEHQRVSSNAQNEPIFVLRGARPTVSPRLLSRFKSSARSWSGQPVAFGVILSGNQLIDNLPYREQIRRFAPEALGGEMEGGGLFAASQDHMHKVDWILVKAISDWADGEKGIDKRSNQLKAARSAARFVFHVLCEGGFK